MNTCEVKSALPSKVKESLAGLIKIRKWELFNKATSQLSNEDKIHVLNEVRESYNNDNSPQAMALKEEISQKINEIENPPTEQIFSTKPLNDFLQKRLKINTTQDSYFIPVFSERTNIKVSELLRAIILKNGFYNEEEGYIVRSTKTLNESLRYYKYELIRNLSKWLGENIDISLSLTTAKDYIAYQELLNKAQHRIEAMTRVSNDGKIISTNQIDINAIRDYYILTNFDDIIRTYTNGAINIARDVNSLGISDNKFISARQSLHGSDWGNSLKSLDGAKNQSKLLKTFLNTIKVGDNYLSSKILTSLISYVYSYSSNNYNIEESIDSLKDSSLEENWEILKRILRSLEVTEKAGGSIYIEAIINALDKYHECFVKSYDGLTSKEAYEFSQYYNLLGQFIHEFNKSTSAIYTLTDATKAAAKPEINDTLSVTRKKTPYWEQLKQALQKARANEYTLYLLSQNAWINGGSLATLNIDFEDPEVQNLIRLISGLSLTGDNYRQLFENKTDVIKDYLRVIASTCQKYSLFYGNSFDLNLENVLNEIKESAPAVVFTDYLIKENVHNLVQLRNGRQDNIPSTITTALIRRFSRNIDSFKKQHKDPSKIQNIFVKMPFLCKKSKNSLFSSHICMANTISFLNGEVADYIDLGEDELFSIGINNFFLQNILYNGIALFLIDVQSNKPNPMLSTINVSHEDNNLYSLSTEDLYNLWYELHKSYYLECQNNFVDIITKLFSKDAKSLEKLNSVSGVKKFETAVELLESLSYLTLEKLRDDYNKDKDPLDKILLRNEVHYCLDKNGKIYYNNGLLLDILACYNDYLANKLYQDAHDSFIKYVKETKSDVHLNIDNLSKNLIDLLLDIIGINRQEFTEKYKVTPEIGLKTLFLNTKTIKWSDGNEILDKILDKFFAMQILCREADIQIMSKSEHCLDSKKTSTLKADAHMSSTELFNLFNNNLPITEWTDEIKKLFEREEARVVGAKKRNNSISATFIPNLPGLLFGVPAYMQVAYYDSPTEDLINHNGQVNEGQAVHDGGIRTLGIFRRFELCSTPGIVPKGKELKIILIESYLEGISQIKCADTVMDNLHIRNSKGESNIVRKMLTPCIVTNTFRENFNKAQRNNNKGFGHEIYYKFSNGDLAKLEMGTLEFIGSDLKFEYTWVTGEHKGETVPVEYVANLLGLKLSNGNAVIENAYDLFKLFGREECRGLKETDNEDNFSEASQELLADLISVCDPKMKETMIAKLIDNSTAKVTITNNNSLDRLNDLDEKATLATATLATSNYGLQQDYAHDANESDIPVLSLMVSALSLNGKNVRKVNYIYELLGDVIFDGLNSVVSDYEGIEIDEKKRKAFTLKIGKLLLDRFASQNRSSDSTRFIEDFLNNINNEFSLGISDPSIFYTASSMILDKLNHRSLRLRFAGAGLIQKPSQGLMMIYRDNKGNTYKRDDIINLALEHGAGKDLENDPNYSILLKNANNDVTEAMILYYLNNSELFKSIPITSSNVHILNIGDAIEILDNNGNIGHKIIKSPFDLWQILKDVRFGNYSYKKEFNKMLDLGTTNITWDNGNLWLLNSTKAKILLEKDKECYSNINTGEIISLKEYSLLTPEELIFYEKINNYRVVSAWFASDHSTLSGKHGDPFYIKSINDFINFSKNGSTIGCVYVNNVETKNGEQITSKTNRTRLDLNHSLAYIRRRGDIYFDKTVRDRYCLGSEIYKNRKVYTDHYINDKGQIINNLSGIIERPAINFGETIAIGDVTYFWNGERFITPPSILAINHQTGFFEDDNIQNLDIIITISSTNYENQDVTFLLDENGKYAAYDLFGNKLFNISEEFKNNVSIKIFKSESGKKQIAVNIKNNNQTNDTIEEIVDNISDRSLAYRVFGDNKTLEKYLTLNKDFNTNPKKEEEEIIKMRKSLYNSFETSLNAISCRIPSQSFLSFTGNRTVAFEEGDENNCYINIWEMWYLGSKI